MNLDSFLVAYRPNDMTVYLGNGSETVVCAAILRNKLQVKPAMSPIHSVLTSVLVLSLSCQAPGRVATGNPAPKLLV